MSHGGFSRPKSGDERCWCGGLGHVAAGDGITAVAGLSGAPLYPLALATVSALRARLGPEITIVGVGGIDSPQKAVAMHRAGADLVQIYTGLVYQGPTLVRECIKALRNPG